MFGCLSALTRLGGSFDDALQNDAFGMDVFVRSGVI